MKIKGRDLLPHIAAIVLFLIVSIIYFSPVLDGKQLSQHDTNTAIGASKEIVDYNKTHNDLALWTNSMFGGMPSYLISLPTKTALTEVFSLTNLYNWRPISFTFLYFLGFYIALLLFGVTPGSLSSGHLLLDFHLTISLLSPPDIIQKLLQSAIWLPSLQEFITLSGKKC